MKRILRWNSPIYSLLAASLFVCIAWCPTSILGQVPITTVPPLRADSTVAIVNWRLAGPFLIDHEEELKAQSTDSIRVGVGRGHDFLRTMNLSEGSVDASTFLQIREGANKPSLGPAFENRVVTADSRNNVMYSEQSSQIQPVKAGAFYLAAVINSACAQDIAIASGVNGNMQLWLNHKLLAADRPNTWYWISNFQHIIGARLNKGNNFLLIKLSHKEGLRGVHLIATLYPHAKALDLSAENHVNPILPSSVVATGQNLSIRGDLFPKHFMADISITDIWNNPVDSTRFTGKQVLKHSLRNLKENDLYICSLFMGGRLIKEPFYYGNLDVVYTKLTEELKGFGELAGPVNVDMKSQLARLKHLLLPESRTSPRWDEKVVESIAEVKHNLADLRKGDVAFRQAPGTHLRGYRSAVDGQIQHYWLHVPAGALDTRKPLPLVIVVPFEVGKNQPFLESYFVADFDMTEAYRSLSDEYGFAVLQVWGRGNGAGGTAIGELDVFEALDAVHRDYNVDLNKIYLLGFCEGGRRALLLGERYPNRFAAIATEHPMISVGSDNLWLKYTSPIESVKNLVDTPVFISHDEAETSPPFESSAIFASRGRDEGVNVTLIQKHGGGVVHGFTPTPTEDLRSMFEFFTGKHRVTAKHSPAVLDIALQRFGRGSGPIEDAFGGPILLVEGTHGTPEQNLAVRSIAEQFRDEWRELYYVECPWKKDIEVTDNDIYSKNIILIGDQDTNSIVKQMSARLPVHVTPNGISVEGKYVQGKHLGYIFISRNPLNMKKYAVLIGMNQWKPMKGWKLYPSRDGQYDYIIYNLEESMLDPLSAGYYNLEWSKFRWFLLHKYVLMASAMFMFLVGIAIRKVRRSVLFPV